MSNVYWLCPKPETASGGVAFIHRLARLCNELGHVSQVWQTEPFDVWWDAEGPYDDVKALVRDDYAGNDVLIIPEVLLCKVDVAAMRAAGIRVIAFIQNHIWAPQDKSHYAGVEIVTVSRHLDNWCRRVLDVKPLGLLSPYASGPWRTSPKTSNKTLVIARRNPQLAGLVKLDLEADGFPVHLLESDVSQNDLAAILDSCEFYVHLSHPEGIPWAAAEAMLSGTIVCGTTGGGGNEFMFDQETAMVVQDPLNGPDPSTEGFSNRILAKMRTLRADTDLRSRMWQNARNWVMGRYTKERTIGQLKAILG